MAYGDDEFHRIEVRDLRHTITRLEAQVTAMTAEIAVDDQLLAEDKRLLDLFDCSTHGARCIPHAIEEVTALRAEWEALRTALEMIRDTDASCLCDHSAIECCAKVGEQCSPCEAAAALLAAQGKQD